MTSCQHGQSQRQCPLCERDETIADLRNDVLRVTMERDALRAEVERLAGSLAACGVVAHGGDGTVLPQYETDSLRAVRAINARLAAAERVCEAARGCLYGESLSLFPTFKQHQDLINSLAAYDAAKETNTP